jgi:hypothetical protein
LTAIREKAIIGGNWDRGRETLPRKLKREIPAAIARLISRAGTEVPMVAPGAKKTYTNEQIRHMSQAVEDYRSTLERLKSGTRSSKIIDKVHKGLLVGEEIQVELEGATRTDGGWELAGNLEERWVKTVERMQDAEEGVRRHRQRWGWLWFLGFVLLLLAVVALYIYLHLRWRPTDPELFLWTGGRKQYAEVAFWTFFGLLTWAVYSMQHWVRAGEDISVWSQ